jgi:hypothetical protein
MTVSHIYQSVTNLQQKTLYSTLCFFVTILIMLGILNAFLDYNIFSFFLSFVFLVELELEFRALYLNYTPRPLFLWLFWRWGLVKHLPGLGSNLNPPDLSLRST